MTTEIIKFHRQIHKQNAMPIKHFTSPYDTNGLQLNTSVQELLTDKTCIYNFRCVDQPKPTRAANQASHELKRWCQ